MTIRARSVEVGPSARNPMNRDRLKPPLTCYDGAEDGIRTRDFTLGKVVVFVFLCAARPPSAILSTQFLPRPPRPFGSPL